MIAVLLAIAMVPTLAPSISWAATTDSGEKAVQEEQAEPKEDPKEETKAEPQEETDAQAESSDDEGVRSEDENKAETGDESAGETGGDPEETAEKQDEDVLYPPQDFNKTVSGITVQIHAPEGALPENTIVEIKAVSKSRVDDQVQDAMGDGAQVIKALDITFRDKDGNKIEPKDGKGLSVRFLSSVFKNLDNAGVVHIRDNGTAEKVSASASGNKVAFKADEFSVYVVVNDAGDDPKLTVEFRTDDGLIESEIVTKEHMDAGRLNDFIYDPGVPDLDGRVFKGWTTEEDYTASTASQTISDVRSAAEAKLRTDAAGDETLVFYAMLFHAYHITYQDELNVTIKTDEVLYRGTAGSETEYEVNQAYTPYFITSTDGSSGGRSGEFAGWKQVFPESETVYGNRDKAALTSDLTLSAQANYGHWLSFDGMGGSYTAPVFVKDGTIPKEAIGSAQAPKKTGYSFGGWYSDPECTTSFASGLPLTKNTTVYAKWDQNPKASYGIVIWKQSVSGGDHYDFAESVTVNDADAGRNTYPISAEGKGGDRYARICTGPGSDDSIDFNQYTGFHLSEAKGSSGQGYDEQTTVAPENNTIINVYYDRNEYTLTFKEDQDGTVYKKITALYGQSIGSNFPITDNGASSEWRWSPISSSTFKQVLVYIDVMPAEDVTFYRSVSLAGTKYIESYVEALPGQTADITWKGKGFIKYGNTIPAKYSYFTEEEDFIDMDGFTKYGSDPAFNSGRADVSDGGTLRLYYTRNPYDIIYRDGIYVEGDKTTPVDETKLPDSYFENASGIAYGADISEKSKYGPTRDGYVFLGWYADDSCTQKYDFSTMPAKNLTVYAKWIRKQYNVVLHNNADGDTTFKYKSDTQKESFYGDYGEIVGDVGGSRDAYELIGWYTDAVWNHPCGVEAFVLNDTNIEEYGSTEYREDQWPGVQGQLNLYARWRSKLSNGNGIHVVYDANGGSNAQTDPGSYADHAEAIACPACTPPRTADKDDSYQFKYWVVQKWNGTAFEDTDVRVFPGDTFSVLRSGAREEALSETDPEYVAEKVTKRYTVQLRAEFAAEGEAAAAHIDWFWNYGSARTPYYKHEGISVNQAVEIPEAPTREGYTFLGWTKAAQSNGAAYDTAEPNFLTWSEADGYRAVESNASATQVVADAVQRTDDAADAMYAVWRVNEASGESEHSDPTASGKQPEKPGYVSDSAAAETGAKTAAVSEAVGAIIAPAHIDRFEFDSNESSLPGLQDLGDNATPQSVYDGKLALLNLIFTIATGVISALLLLLYFIKKREDEDQGEEGKSRKKLMIRLLGLIPAITAIITFIITEDLTQPLELTDRFTVLMLLFLLVEAFVVFVAKEMTDAEERAKDRQL